MLENFPVYLRKKRHLLSQYHKIQFVVKIHIYPVVQSFQDFPLLSLSLLQKISSGTIDAVKCANALRIEGKISEDVCMIFDEMYLQKRQEHFWGEMIGCDDEGELYKGIVCFMIVGLKESIPYVIK